MDLICERSFFRLTFLRAPLDLDFLTIFVDTHYRARIVREESCELEREIGALDCIHNVPDPLRTEAISIQFQVLKIA